MFQHTAARRRLVKPLSTLALPRWFQHTAARRRLGLSTIRSCGCRWVSTHSRPKAAGASVETFRQLFAKFQHTAARRRLVYLGMHTHATVGFNTQPPEGGWLPILFPAPRRFRFNTQPPEGGWLKDGLIEMYDVEFQHTAARRRLEPRNHRKSDLNSFNTQPPEGGWRLLFQQQTAPTQFQHTAARRRLGPPYAEYPCHVQFQHTAARRRLGATSSLRRSKPLRFNTQPPEGGWAARAPSRFP